MRSRCGLHVLLVVSASAGAARAEGTPDAGAPPGAGAVDEAEIRRAMQADEAARAKLTGTQPSPPPAAAPDTAVAGRGFQSLNPDVSVILDLAAGWYSDEAGTIKSGDDPKSTGFNAQEIELALQQVVDPYFRADVYLTIPNLEALEVEEAYVTTSQLPWNLQLKAGVFRAALGRQNAQHLHQQDFVRRPTLNPQLLGIDGLRAPGLEVNWLVPGLPFYLVLSGAGMSVTPAEPEQTLQTFGGGERWDFTYVGYARAFFPVSEATSVYFGLDYAHGTSSQSALGPAAGAFVPTVFDNRNDNLYGADLYVKWKPANQAQTYASLAWQSEYFVRQIPSVSQLEGGVYSQIVAQTHRRLYIGVRGELMGIPSGDNIHREYAGEFSVTWALTEWSRIRLYGEVRHGPPFVPPAVLPTPALPAQLSGAAFIQLEAAYGAHGAHPF